MDIGTSTEVDATHRVSLVWLRMPVRGRNLGRGNAQLLACPLAARLGGGAA